MAGLVCLSVSMPLELSAQSLLERVVTDVILGVYDKPRYRDDRPYYVYNNRYYYGGDWRNGDYYYDGKRLSGGHYYERGYEEHHRKKYKKEKHPNHKNGYYKHNKHYLGQHQRDRYDDKRYRQDSKRYKKDNKHKHK